MVEWSWQTEYRERAEKALAELREKGGPKHQHDCEQCRFLGQWVGRSDKRTYDLYACASDKAAGTTLHARWGSLPEQISNRRLSEIERAFREKHVIAGDAIMALYQAHDRWSQRNAEAEKTWIIPKDWRACREYHCESFRQPKTVKIEVNGREIKTTCKTCGGTFEGRLDEYTEPRPCKRCGHVRRVRVRIWKTSDGKGGWKETEHVEDRCAACKLEVQANKYASMVQEMRAKAAKLREGYKKGGRP